MIQLECSLIDCSQDCAHSLTAAAILLGQVKALLRVAVDLPEALTGERQLDQPHEGGHVLGRITDKEADLVGEGVTGFDAPAQFTQQSID